MSLNTVGGLPIAEILLVTPYRHTRTVIVICPFCGKRAGHGWKWREDSVGVRTSDCKDKTKVGTYYVPSPPFDCSAEARLAWGVPFNSPPRRVRLVSVENLAPEIAP